MKRLYIALAVVTALAGCAKKDIGEPCEEPSECEYDVCLGAAVSDSHRKICTKHCASETECPNAGRCISGTCEATCTSQGDCPAETQCREGLCLVECRSQDDCINATCPAPGQVCEQ